MNYYLYLKKEEIQSNANYYNKIPFFFRVVQYVYMCEGGKGENMYLSILSLDICKKDLQNKYSRSSTGFSVTVHRCENTTTTLYQAERSG